jgi:hypothetical protein
LERDDVLHDVFGLAETMPRPGWVVLDAARDHRFTGELTFHTNPAVAVYLDRGRIYFAERLGDAPIGLQLVEAGVLTAAQLDHGSIRIGGTENIGRLFERCPLADRDVALVAVNLLTEECFGWLASQRVRAVDVKPYRFHVSGLHQWDRADGAIDLSPGDPLPAPSPAERPLFVESPESLVDSFQSFDAADTMIEWQERSWLDDRLPPGPSEQDQDPFARDWIERFETEGLPAAGSDPLATIPAQLPLVSLEPIDRFEVIWPSGEIDEQFGMTDDVLTDEIEALRDHDRSGPTVRLSRSDIAEAPAPLAGSSPAESSPVEPSPVEPDPADAIVLAVRGAVASIDTGSLEVRRRLVESPALDPQSSDSPGGGSSMIVPPGRVAVRSEHNEWAPVPVTPLRSVFDGLVTSTTAGATDSSMAAVALDTGRGESGDRTSALRRLIGTLRGR